MGRTGVQSHRVQIFYLSQNVKRRFKATQFSVPLALVGIPTTKDDTDHHLVFIAKVEKECLQYFTP